MLHVSVLLWYSYTSMHSQDNAELAVRDMLREIASKTLAHSGTTCLYAEDFMDNGARIALKVEINKEEVNNSCLVN